MKTLISIFVLFFLFTVIHSWAADFNKGQDAFDRGDYTTAYEEWKILAKQGDVEAQNVLGEMFLQGLGVSQDYKLAIKWFKKAANKGHPYAQNNLAVMYMKGLGTSKKEKRAVKLFKLAAEQGSSESQTSLGYIYHYGRGVSKDYNKAMKWYQLAANQGHAEAQHRVGRYYNDFQEFKNYELALKWFQLSADQGYARAQGSLGFMYKEGRGVSQNYDEALKWYHLAADKGDFISQMTLYHLYERGEKIPQDLEQAKKWYELINGEEYDYETVQLERKEEEKKSKQNKLWGEALNASDEGMNYMPFQKFKDLADDGHRESQYLVGLMYREGRHVIFDSDQVEKYWKLAAEQGHEEAKKMLELYYESATFKNKTPTAEYLFNFNLIGKIIIVIILFSIIIFALGVIRKLLQRNR